MEAGSSQGVDGGGRSNLNCHSLSSSSSSSSSSFIAHSTTVFSLCWRLPSHILNVLVPHPEGKTVFSCPPMWPTVRHPIPEDSAYSHVSARPERVEDPALGSGCWGYRQPANAPPCPGAREEKGSAGSERRERAGEDGLGGVRRRERLRASAAVSISGELSAQIQ